MPHRFVFTRRRMVMADATLIDQALFNLIENALMSIAGRAEAGDHRRRDL